MFIALDANKNRVSIDNAEKGVQFFCPICGKPVILKQGKINAHHFAHTANSECTDNWKHDMSEWHLNWQNKFPLDCQEVVMTSGKEIHRADVFINNTVFEFQHSSMSNLEFNERNNFYNSLGYKVVWVFDFIEAKESCKISTISNRLYEWPRPKSTFLDYNPNNPMILVFFQFYSESDHKTGFVEKVTWHCEDGFRFFSTDNVDHNNDRFVQNYCLPKKLFYREKLYDDMYNDHNAGNIGHATKFKGCPISISGYALSNEIDEDTSICCICSHCEHSFDYFKCKYAADCLNIPENAKRVIPYRDQNHIITSISYDLNGKTIEAIVPKPIREVDTILNFWNKNQPISALIVKNSKTSVFAKIIKDPNYSFKRYHAVYGYISRDPMRFDFDSQEIYYADKKYWELIKVIK